MKKLLGLFLAVALLSASWAGVAQAEKIDFNKFTCNQFVELAEGDDADTLAMLYFWLDGFVSAKSGDLVMDTDNVENDLNELLKLCKADRNSRLLSVLGH